MAIQWEKKYPRRNPLNEKGKVFNLRVLRVGKMIVTPGQVAHVTWE